MKRIVVLLLSAIMVFTFAVATYAEDLETESAMTEETIVAEETAEETETEDDITIEDIMSTINALTPEQFQKLQEQILAICKATGWDAVDEFVNKNIFMITLMVFTAGVVIYFVFFKKNGANLSNGIQALAQRSSEMISEATKISKESSDQAQKATDAINGYLEQATKVIESLSKKEDEIAKKDEQIANLEEQFKTELSNNKGAILAMASCVQSLLQMSGIPDEQKMLIQARYDNEIAKMNGGE